MLGTLGIIVEPIPANVALLSLVYSATFTLGIDPLKVLIFRKTGLLS
jgi:hypothetical protein